MVQVTLLFFMNRASVTVYGDAEPLVSTASSFADVEAKLSGPLMYRPREDAVRLSKMRRPELSTVTPDDEETTEDHKPPEYWQLVLTTSAAELVMVVAGSTAPHART